MTFLKKLDKIVPEKIITSQNDTRNANQDAINYKNDREKALKHSYVNEDYYNKNNNNQICTYIDKEFLNIKKPY